MGHVARGYGTVRQGGPRLSWNFLERKNWLRHEGKLRREDSLIHLGFLIQGPSDIRGIAGTFDYVRVKASS